MNFNVHRDMMRAWWVMETLVADTSVKMSLIFGWANHINDQKMHALQPQESTTIVQSAHTHTHTQLEKRHEMSSCHIFTFFVQGSFCRNDCLTAETNRPVGPNEISVP